VWGNLLSHLLPFPQTNHPHPTTTNQSPTKRDAHTLLLGDKRCWKVTNLAIFSGIMLKVCLQVERSGMGFSSAPPPTAAVPNRQTEVLLV